MLGLPQPSPDTPSARVQYVAWRKEAWTQYWLDELDLGIEEASRQWLDGFWTALGGLLGGNDAAGPKRQIDESGPGALHIRGRQQQVRSALPLPTLQNNGTRCFAGMASPAGYTEVQALELSTLMINLGRRCNQVCHHCHVDAGPHRTEEMSRETIDLVIDVLRRHQIDTLDITGGAPEMNPHFRHLAATAAGLCRRVIDRCNLTILLEPGQEDLPGFLAAHRIEITASLPSFEAADVERQRGRGVFGKSIEALRLLNSLGYGAAGSGRILNLVYNPVGTELASPQAELERRFKQRLDGVYGVVFNHLFAMNNLPVNRFHDQLVREQGLESYMVRLVEGFNPTTVDGLMCRHSISVGWDGRLHDCDFNHVMDQPMSPGMPQHIRDFDATVLSKRPIHTAAHCFGCTARFGSSCSGALTDAAPAPDARRNGHSQEVAVARR